MARPTRDLVHALYGTAERLERGAAYKWSNFASCNCGNLVQSITQLSPREIYQAAFARAGDWGEQAQEYCPSSGYPIDYILERLFALGLTADDVRHLERLSDPKVLARAGGRELRYTDRTHVVRYMRAWADLLESELPYEAPLAQAAE